VECAQVTVFELHVPGGLSTPTIELLACWALQVYRIIPLHTPRLLTAMNCSGISNVVPNRWDRHSPARAWLRMRTPGRAATSDRDT
jgi:hypothetical protein